MLGQQRALARVASGVCELQTDEQIVVGAAAFTVRSVAELHEFLECRCGGAVDHKLAGVGPAFRNHGACLAPDQLGAPGAEPTIAAQGQLAGRAVRVGIATFHGLNHQTIAHLLAGKRTGRPQDIEIFLKPDVQSHGLRVVQECLSGLVFEVTRHRIAFPMPTIGRMVEICACRSTSPSWHSRPVMARSEDRPIAIHVLSGAIA